MTYAKYGSSYLAPFGPTRKQGACPCYGPTRKNPAWTLSLEFAIIKCCVSSQRARSSMDRASASEAGNVGSTPAERKI